MGFHFGGNQNPFQVASYFFKTTSFYQITTYLRITKWLLPKDRVRGPPRINSENWRIERFAQRKESQLPKAVWRVLESPSKNPYLPRFQPKLTLTIVVMTTTVNMSNRGRPKTSTKEIWKSSEMKQVILATQGVIQTVKERFSGMPA